MEIEDILIFGLPIVVLTLTACYFYFRYKDTLIMYITQKKINDEYISMIKKEMDNGRQLRRGFIEEDLTHTEDGGDKKKYKVLAEVREVERTHTRSKIEVICYRSIGSTDLNSDFSGAESLLDGSMRRYYNGWVDPSTIEWVIETDGREEVINELLNQIELENK